MRWPLVILALSLTGCADFVAAYNQDYVLYDASKAPAPAGTPAGDFARLLDCERLLAEIDRSIGDGLDADGALATKRGQLAAAIEARRAALGDGLGALRRARAAELRELEVR